MKFLHLKPQMQPLSIRSSDIAFTMGAKGPLWERVKHFDGEIPLFRERETRKMKESIIYVHGKGGSAEEADHYKPLFRIAKSSASTTAPRRRGRPKRNSWLFLRRNGSAVIALY